MWKCKWDSVYRIRWESAMLVDLTDIFTEEGKSVTKEIPLELDHVRVGGEEFGILEKSPIALTLMNLRSGKALIEAKARVRIAMRCDRCLQPVVKELELHIAEEVSSAETADGSEEGEAAEFVKRNQLDTDCLISNEIFACWPMKILCREDCKGLCKVCGKDLNQGSCDCDAFVPDPRMAAIMDIFHGNKEV